METECDGAAVFGTQAAVRAENEDFRAEDVSGVPAHADVHAEAEEISRRLCEQHLRSDGKNTDGAGRVRSDCAEFEVGALKYGGE
jgi:hypothetical protein